MIIRHDDTSADTDAATSDEAIASSATEAAGAAADAAPSAPDDAETVVPDDDASAAEAPDAPDATETAGAADADANERGAAVIGLCGDEAPDGPGWYYADPEDGAVGPFETFDEARAYAYGAGFHATIPSAAPGSAGPACVTYFNDGDRGPGWYCVGLQGETIAAPFPTRHHAMEEALDLGHEIVPLPAPPEPAPAPESIDAAADGTGDGAGEGGSAHDAAHNDNGDASPSADVDAAPSEPEPEPEPAAPLPPPRVIVQVEAGFQAAWLEATFDPETIVLLTMHATTGTSYTPGTSCELKRSWADLGQLAGDRLGRTWIRCAHHVFAPDQHAAIQANAYLGMMKAAGGWDADRDACPVLRIEPRALVDDVAEIYRMAPAVKALAAIIRKRTGRAVLLSVAGAMPAGLVELLGCDAAFPELTGPDAVAHDDELRQAIITGKGAA